MIKLFAILAIVIFFNNNILAKEEVSIGIAHYPPYVDKKKKDLGIYPSYIKKFFNFNGYNSNFIILPYSRTLSFISDKKILDFTIIGQSNIKEIQSKTKLLVSKPFFKVKICIFYNKDKYPKGIEYKGYESLKKYKTISIIKSPVNEHLKQNNIEYTNIKKIQNAIKLLSLKRADIFLNSLTITSHYIAKLKLDGSIVCDSHISSEGIHFITPYTKKYKTIMNKFNQYIENNPLK